VGTLNLCLETPDLMENVLSQLDHPARRNRPKCAKILIIVKTANFQWFLCFFSAHIDPIELKPFLMNQASRDTSLEYQQWVLWITLKCQYFLL